MPRILNCTKLTITRLIQRYRVTDRTADTPRSGIPRVEHVSFNIANVHRNWQRVLFSDRSRFQSFRADDKTRIYRQAGERTDPCCVQETVIFGLDL